MRIMHKTSGSCRYASPAHQAGKAGVRARMDESIGGCWPHMPTIRVSVHHCNEMRRRTLVCTGIDVHVAGVQPGGGMGCAYSCTKALSTGVRIHDMYTMQ